MNTEYFERTEGSLAYSDYGGTGALVLMAPGLGDLRGEYRFLAPRLAGEGYHAVSFDLRGHGQSSVPWPSYDIPSVGGDILAMVEHLGSGPACVVATSFSAGAAVWAAVEQPERVSSLVLIGGSVRGGNANPAMKAATWILLHNPWRVYTWLTYFKSLYPERRPDDFEEYVRSLRENLKEPGRFSAAAAMAECSRLPSEERLGRVSVPTLVLMGTKDRDFPDPAAEGQYIASTTRGVLKLVEGAGHYPHVEMPDVTAPLVLEFMKQPSRPA